jgi:hypothetical protein
MNKCISCLEPAKELNKGYCGKCETVINNRLQKARSRGDRQSHDLVAITEEIEKDVCQICNTHNDVHECWNCDINLCIDCDAGEMRTDLDGHTYCDNCEPKWD